jgi:hypothetical protein
MRGIVLLAVCKPTYGKFAFNLRTSLKVQNPDVPVQLFCDDEAIKHLQDWQLASFDVVTKIDPSEYEFNGRREPGRLKAFLYDRYAFDEVMFMDVDSIAIKPVPMDWPDEFLSLVSPTNYWATDETYHRHFKLNEDDQVPATNSSMFWVKKGMKTQKLFKQWQKNFDNPIKKEDVPKNGEWFNGLTPDEPYLNAALAKLGIDPDFKTPMMFCQWKVSPMPPLSEIEAVALSFWGHPSQIHHELKKLYDKMMTKYMIAVWNSNKIYNAERLVREKSND